MHLGRDQWVFIVTEQFVLEMRTGTPRLSYLTFCINHNNQTVIWSSGFHNTTPCWSYHFRKTWALISIMDLYEKMPLTWWTHLFMQYTYVMMLHTCLTLSSGSGNTVSKFPPFKFMCLKENVLWVVSLFIIPGLGAQGSLDKGKKVRGKSESLKVNLKESTPHPGVLWKGRFWGRNRKDR